MGSQAYAFGIAAMMLVGAACVARAEPPTPEQYVANVGGGAQVIPVGALKIDGHTTICGQRPTVLDNSLDDYAAAYPGFLIINSKLLSTIKSTAVKLWIHAHECGHQFRGPDEETADCFAVQRGRRQGWLTPAALEEVCQFIAPAKGDHLHSNGKQRCELMRKCYVDKSVH